MAVEKTLEEKIIGDIGLTGTEAKVYLALLESGSTTAGEIAKKIKSYRRNVYDFLDKLIERGLVSIVIKNKKRHYDAVEPEKLLNILHEKEENLLRILPQLESYRKAEKNKDLVHVYFGKEGIKTFFERSLKIGKQGETIFILGGSGKTKTFGQYSRDYWDAQRLKHRVKVKMLSSEKREDIFKQNKYTEVRYLPKESFPISFSIYGDYVDQMIFTNIPITISIKSKIAAEGFLEYFDILWRLAGK